MDEMPVANAYRTLHFLVRYGDWVALVVALVPLLAGIWLAVSDESVGYGVAGLAVSAFLYLLMRSYVELVRVIVDMLLPK